MFKDIVLYPGSPNCTCRSSSCFVALVRRLFQEDCFCCLARLAASAEVWPCLWTLIVLLPGSFNCTCKSLSRFVATVQWLFQRHCSFQCLDLSTALAEVRPVSGALGRQVGPGTAVSRALGRQVGRGWAVSSTL